MADSFPIRFGRYELIERIAIGGMAEIFLATVDGEHGFAKRVVIKRLLPHLAREPAYTAMFIDEAKLTARLVHPKIAQTYELGRVQESLFIAMEHVDGVDVLALLREFALRRERVPVDLSVWVAHEVLDALDYAHQLTDPDGHPIGVVHRDISPSNVLLSRRGDVKLVDFGIARASEPGRHHRTKSGTLKGKYGYMSPEQVLEEPVDARSDIFSVGIVLAELLMGRRLFAAPNELDVLLMVRDAKLARFDEYGGHVEPGLGQILRRALRKDRDERWHTAGEMRDALDDWLFQQRLRVTPRRVADAVEQVYDTVWEKRRKHGVESGAEDAVVPPQAAVAAPAAPGVSAPHRAPTSHETPRALRDAADSLVLIDDGDGIPKGFDPIDSGPVVSIEEPPMLEVAPPATPAAPTMRHKAATVPPPAQPIVPVSGQNRRPVVHIPPKSDAGGPPPPPRSAGSSPAIKIPAPAPRAETSVARKLPSPPPESSTTSRLPGPPPNLNLPTSRGRVSERNLPIAEADVDAEVADFERALADLELPAADVDTALALIDSDDAALPSEAPRRASATTPPGARGASTRYSSIEAAVSALSRKQPDPSTVEFDGKQVGTPRRPTGEVPVITADELERAVRQPPPPLADEDGTPDEHGEFPTTSPLRLLYRFLSGKQTGLLVTRVGAIKKEIYIRDGMPEYVSSNVSSELLGNYLVQQNVLSQGELAMALAMMPHYSGKLGDTLVGLGLLKPLEVFRHLTRQIRQKLIDVCTWTRGNWAWYEGKINTREAFPLDLNAFEVLGAGAAALPAPAVDQWLDRWRNLRLRATKGRFSVDRFEQPGLRSIYDGLDGKKTVEEVLARWPEAADRQRATRMLVLLEMCELARAA